MIDAFREAVANPGSTIAHWRQELNQPVVAVMPAYFPEELVTAAGAYPVGMWGRTGPIVKADRYVQSFVCSLARANLEMALGSTGQAVDAYIFPSICDTFQNLAEIFQMVLKDRPVLPFVFPSTSSQALRGDFLKRQIGFADEFLKKVTGQQVTAEKLKDAIETYQKSRELLKRLYQYRRDHFDCISNEDFYTVIKSSLFLPRFAFNRLLEKLLRELSPDHRVGGGIPVFLSGITAEPFAMLPLMTDLKLFTVDDDLLLGWRIFSRDVSTQGDPFESLAAAVFSGSPCSTLFDQIKDRQKSLVTQVKESNARGVIFWYLKYCEPEAFDIPDLQESLQKERIPSMIIEVDLTMENLEQVKTKLGGFREILEGGAQG